MSLFATALRFATVETLRGQTIAGAHVYDTAGDIGPSDADVARAAIVVETAESLGRRFVLSITLSVMVRDVAVSETGDAAIVWQTAPATPATERALDLMAHQIVVALALEDTPFAMLGAVPDLDQLRIAPVVAGLALRALTVPIDGTSRLGGFVSYLEACEPADAAFFKSALSSPSAVDIGDLGLSCGVTAHHADVMLATGSQGSAVVENPKSRRRKAP